MTGATGRDLAELLERGRRALDGVPEEERAAVRAVLVDLVESGSGTRRERLEIGEILGHIGDPRLRLPSDRDYWVTVEWDDGTRFQVGRFMVTTWEYARWSDEGGYDDDAAWSEEGLRWRDTRQRTWRDLASAPGVDHLTVPNQPVVGVSWWEAEAYARSHGARLLTMAERRWVVRGPERRPYPWGEPFGSGNANTREEALGRPCAVGLYRADRTPHGVFDLAGNVAEWTADRANGQRVLHPGSWSQPAMAAWAKAVEMAEPKTRSADLGFRLARG